MRYAPEDRNVPVIFSILSATPIDRVNELNPDDRADVERVRNTTAGGRDKWHSKKTYTAASRVGLGT
jgi:hypothetical protein